MAEAWLVNGVRVRAVVSDVDGVLTDGRVYISASGDEGRAFDMKDGMGVKLLQKAGISVGWLSAAKDTGLVRARAQTLGVAHVDVGEGDKGERFLRLCVDMGAEPGETIYIGDDVNDLPAMERAALTVCPSDATPGVRRAVDLVLEARGGRGAFRELAEMILAAERV